MKKETYEKIGDVYFPKANKLRISDTEIVGDRWKAWLSDGSFYLEYDSGSFFDNFKVISITEKQFYRLKEQSASVVDVVKEAKSK